MPELRIAQISDLHVRRESDKRAHEFDEWATQCIERVNAAAPDVVIATGDLADNGDEEEYRRLRALLSALSRPYYVMPGNHDDPDAMRRIFSDHGYLFQTDGHVSYAIDAGAVRILALDSMKPGRAGGYLDEARLGWLESQLAMDSRRPVLLALHHPPFAAGVWPMDWLGFVKKRELEAVVRAHPLILRIVSGHVHCARAAMWGGTYACTTPSTRPQRLLVGVGWHPPALCLEHPGFLVHSLDGAGAFHTDVHRVDGTVERLECFS